MSAVHLVFIFLICLSFSAARKLPVLPCSQGDAPGNIHHEIRRRRSSFLSYIRNMAHEILLGESKEFLPFTRFCISMTPSISNTPSSSPTPSLSSSPSASSAPTLSSSPSASSSTSPTTSNTKSPSPSEPKRSNVLLTESEVPSTSNPTAVTPLITPTNSASTPTQSPSSAAIVSVSPFASISITTSLSASSSPSETLLYSPVSSTSSTPSRSTSQSGTPSSSISAVATSSMTSSPSISIPISPTVTPLGTFSESPVPSTTSTPSNSISQSSTPSSSISPAATISMSATPSKSVLTSPTGSLSPTQISPFPKDAHGISMIYASEDVTSPSEFGEFDWISRWVNYSSDVSLERVFEEDPNDDQIVLRGNGDATIFGDPVGELSAIKSPRIFIHSKQDGWENVEFTAYGYYESDFDPALTARAGLTLVARSSHSINRDEACLETRYLDKICHPCNAAGYYTKIYRDPGTGKDEIMFQKEYYHYIDQNNYQITFYSPTNRVSYFTGRKLPVQTWIGMKFIVYTIPNTVNVQLELWIDENDGTNGGDWKLVHSFIDEPGKWKAAGGAEIPNNCTEVPNGGTILGPREDCYLRSDYSIVNWKRASVRKIQPGNRL